MQADHKHCHLNVQTTNSGQVFRWETIVSWWGQRIKIHNFGTEHTPEKAATGQIDKALDFVETHVLWAGTIASKRPKLLINRTEQARPKRRPVVQWSFWTQSMPRILPKNRPVHTFFRHRIDHIDDHNHEICVKVDNVLPPQKDPIAGAGGSMKFLRKSSVE